MKIMQLSVFLENRHGQLADTCATLAEAGCNLLALNLAEANPLGILRLILDDYRAGQSALEVAGAVVTVTEVVAIEVPDHPGGLAPILDIIDREKINLDYMYAFTRQHKKTSVVIFRFEDPSAALVNLRRHGIDLLEGAPFFKQA